MSNFAINPEWKAYNDVMNEGGEGYNPHRKWVAKSAVAKAAASVAGEGDRMLKDQDGNLIPASKMALRLEKNIARRAGLTNAYAIEIVEESIAFDRAALGVE